MVAAVIRIRDGLRPLRSYLVRFWISAQVWSTSCTASGAAATAQAIRQLLPTIVPPRLLLPALFGQWGAAQVAACRYNLCLFLSCTAVGSQQSWQSDLTLLTCHECNTGLKRPCSCAEHLCSVIS